MNESNGRKLRKDIRKNARLSLKKHYWIFVVAALAAAILGTQYANTTQVFRIQKRIRTEKAEDSSVGESLAGVRSAMGVDGSTDGSVFNDLINGDWQNIIDAVGYRMEVLQGK